MEKTVLKKIIIDQKEEVVSLPERVRLVERSCFRTYQKYMGMKQIKVITGVRRCGKSVLSYQLLAGRPFAYVNFDDERLANMDLNGLNDVLEVFYEVYGDFKYVFLDEIQNIKGWELFVNRIQRQGFNIIITGSNARLLSRELATHLTGRHIALELLPFSFEEFLRYHHLILDIKSLSTKETGLLKNKLNDYILLGGFPEIISQPMNQKIYLQSLYSSILDKDIILRHKIKFEKILKEISSHFISNIASQVSFHKIKNIFHLKSVHTALNYLSFMEESFLFFLVPRFSFKSKERATANRKIYLIDTGLVNALSFNFSQNKGRIYENIVFLELMRRRLTVPSEIYYWQDIMKNEVDFVLKQSTKIKELIQVCCDVGDYDTKKREVRALIKASKELKCKNLLVITEDYEAKENADGRTIRFIPIWKWLLE